MRLHPRSVIITSLFLTISFVGANAQQVHADTTPQKRYCKKQAGDDNAAWMKSHESKAFL
jgi:hypothetical protein